MQHKLATFRHMIHRVKTISVTQDNYNTELNMIYDNVSKDKEMTMTTGYKPTPTNIQTSNALAEQKSGQV